MVSGGAIGADWFYTSSFVASSRGVLEFAETNRNWLSDHHQYSTVQYSTLRTIPLLKMNSMDLRRGRKVGGRNLSPSSASKLPTLVIEEDLFWVSHQSSSYLLNGKRKGGEKATTMDVFWKCALLLVCIIILPYQVPTRFVYTSFQFPVLSSSVIVCPPYRTTVSSHSHTIQYSFPKGRTGS